MLRRWQATILSLVFFPSALNFTWNVPSAFSQSPRYVTVEVDGVGDSPQTAVRNATENGLKRVLGSYMDTETRIEERSKVENGEQKTSEQVTQKIREYSKGMVKDVERLSVELNGGIYHARARVTVRILQ